MSSNFVKIELSSFHIKNLLACCKKGWISVTITSYPQSTNGSTPKPVSVTQVFQWKGRERWPKVGEDTDPRLLFIIPNTGEYELQVRVVQSEQEMANRIANALDFGFLLTRDIAAVATPIGAAIPQYGPAVQAGLELISIGAQIANATTDLIASLITDRPLLTAYTTIRPFTGLANPTPPPSKCFFLNKQTPQQIRALAAYHGIDNAANRQDEQVASDLEKHFPSFKSDYAEVQLRITPVDQPLDAARNVKLTVVKAKIVNHDRFVGRQLTLAINVGAAADDLGRQLQVLLHQGAGRLENSLLLEDWDIYSRDSTEQELPITITMTVAPANPNQAATANKFVSTVVSSVKDTVKTLQSAPFGGSKLPPELTQLPAETPSSITQVLMQIYQTNVLAPLMTTIPIPPLGTPDKFYRVSFNGNTASIEEIQDPALRVHSTGCHCLVGCTSSITTCLRQCFQPVIGCLSSAFYCFSGCLCAGGCCCCCCGGGDNCLCCPRISGEIEGEMILKLTVDQPTAAPPSVDVSRSLAIIALGSRLNDIVNNQIATDLIVPDLQQVLLFLACHLEIVLRPFRSTSRTSDQDEPETPVEKLPPSSAVTSLSALHQVLKPFGVGTSMPAPNRAEMVRLAQIFNFYFKPDANLRKQLLDANANHEVGLSDDGRSILKMLLCFFHDLYEQCLFPSIDSLSDQYAQAIARRILASERRETQCQAIACAALGWDDLHIKLDQVPRKFQPLVIQAKNCQGDWRTFVNTIDPGTRPTDTVVVTEEQREVAKADTILGSADLKRQLKQELANLVKKIRSGTITEEYALEVVAAVLVAKGGLQDELAQIAFRSTNDDIVATPQQLFQLRDLARTMRFVLGPFVPQGGAQARFLVSDADWPNRPPNNQALKDLLARLSLDATEQARIDYSTNLKCLASALVRNLSPFWIPRAPAAVDSLMRSLAAALQGVLLPYYDV